MVGRLVDQKNYFVAIDILKDLNLKLDIVGSGPLKKRYNITAHKKKIKYPFWIT